MTLGSLLAPITAATILSIFVFAAAWRSDQIEKRTGVLPWWIVAASLLLGVPLVAFLYYARSRTLSGGIDIFCVAVAAQIIGALVVYGVVQFLRSMRGETRKERAISISGGAFIIVAIALLALKWHPGARPKPAQPRGREAA